MKAYEQGTPAYFATPPVQLVYAFYASLKTIVEGKFGIEERFRLHKVASQKIKDAAAGLGLKQVPLDPAYSSNGMTAVRAFPVLFLGSALGLGLTTYSWSWITVVLPRRLRRC